MFTSLVPQVAVRFDQTLQTFAMKDLAFWRNMDSGSDNLHINFEDFVTFCETKIENIDDIEFLKMTAENFLKVSARRDHLIRESWQESSVHLGAQLRGSSIAGRSVGFGKLVPNSEEKFAQQLVGTGLVFRLAPQAPQLNNSAPGRLRNMVTFGRRCVHRDRAGRRRMWRGRTQQRQA